MGISESGCSSFLVHVDTHVVAQTAELYMNSKVHTYLCSSGVFMRMYFLIEALYILFYDCVTLCASPNLDAAVVDCCIRMT